MGLETGEPNFSSRSGIISQKMFGCLHPAMFLSRRILSSSSWRTLAPSYEKQIATFLYQVQYRQTKPLFIEELLIVH